MITNEEFLEIENHLELVANQLNVTDVLANHLFRSRSSVDAQEQISTPRERIIEKIRVLERALSLYDLKTFTKAMKNIERAARPPKEASILRGEEKAQDSYEYGRIPQRVELVESGVAEDATQEQLFNFAELPDLAKARSMLRSLAKDLREA